MKFTITKTGLSSHITHFGPVFCAPWVRGFYKEEPWFYFFFRILGMRWSNTTFMAKTVTLEPHNGNVPLKKNGKPKFLLSRYVYWNPFKKNMVNSFGLSNPGLYYCIRQWKEYQDPFVISIMSLKEHRQERDDEVRLVVSKLQDFAQNDALTSFAVQFNAGCPNAGAHNTEDVQSLLDELHTRAAQLKKIGMPIFLNCSPAMPLEIILTVHKDWDAIIIGNTIMFGHECIQDWTRVTYDGVSPLIKRGLNVLGGYSGKEATPISVALIRALRENGVSTPIIGGNSIQSKANVDAFHDAGANGIIIGSLALNNPLEMADIISYAQSLQWDDALNQTT